jgi:hypothetical protein
MQYCNITMNIILKTQEAQLIQKKLSDLLRFYGPYLRKLRKLLEIRFSFFQKGILSFVRFF